MSAFIDGLWAFARVRKKHWLLPMVIVLVDLSVLPIVALSSGITPLIPFGRQ